MATKNNAQKWNFEYDACEKWEETERETYVYVFYIIYLLLYRKVNKSQTFVLL